HSVGRLPGGNGQIGASLGLRVECVIAVHPDLENTRADLRICEAFTEPRIVFGSSEFQETHRTVARIVLREGLAWIAVKDQSKIILHGPPHTDVIHAVETGTDGWFDLVEVFLVHDDD